MAHNIFHVEQAARQAVGDLGGNPDNWVAIAAQFILEKGWSWWENPQPPYNVGNVTNGGVSAGFATYPNLSDGILGYVNVLRHTSFDEGKTLVYSNVLEAIEHGTPEDVLNALHNSPFCEPPYPLSSLESIMKEIEPMTTPNETIAQVQQDIKDIDAQIAKLNSEKADKENELKELESHNNIDYVTVTQQPPYNTLWGIATEKLGNGNRWTELMKLNPSVNPRALHVGQKIRYK